MDWILAVYRLVAALLRPYTLFFLLTGLALAYLWCSRRESRRRLLLAVVPFGFLTATSLPVVGQLALGTLEWRYPPRVQRPADAEAIVVLSGSVVVRDPVRARAELGANSMYRCLRAAEVYHLGPPIPVLATGGKADPSAPVPACADLMADFLRRQGVRDADLIVEARSRSTYENAIETRKLLDMRRLRRVVLVTDATHMPRSVLCFRKQGVEVTPWPCNQRATGLNPSLALVLPSPGAAQACMDAAYEWLGLAWYWLHGRV
jgi:uncharacterized SAM-binding protein YcdF (DUF218 family)